ncbi:hypothetical protein LCGC14_1745370 [marine sediment metagenome]|uniref:Spore protein YkvP/CgeB glycosyl transferase-like domain-containing protein n=1 Tax=marine sediment metagenome TaxID=412755 RepID=A0A0F9K522_9ZZZZ
MTASLLIGGGFFTHERLSLAKLIEGDRELRVRTIGVKDLLKPRMKLEGDCVVLFGLKKMERLLRKERLDSRKITSYIWKFLDKTISPKIPLVVVDDWSLPLLSKYGIKLRKHFFANFNVRRYLLREYLTTEKYPKQVVSFTLPCNDYTRFMVDVSKKETDIFFQGNLSNKDRSHLFKKIRKHTKKFKCRYKTMTGGVKNIKDRLPFKEFLKVMAKSKLSLHFCGTGYDCYRYQEIPAVGSIIVTPRYPWIVRNDYEDMKSCIVYGNPKDLKSKVKKVLGSQQLLAEMQYNAIERFRKYHTSEVRYQELKEFIGVVSRKPLGL